MARQKRRSGRTAKQTQNLRLLVLTGIPGTGKTEIATRLHERHGFRHIDLEHGPTLQRFLGSGDTSFRARVQQLKSARRDTVVSWGFVPDVQLRYVLMLRQSGFVWFWFDGDRDAAHKTYLQAGRPEMPWVVQLQKIKTFIDPRMDELDPVRINTFNDAGDFRVHEDIVEELLGKL